MIVDRDLIFLAQSLKSKARMSPKSTPKRPKAILKTNLKATKRVRVSEDACAKVDPTPKFSSKSKGKQPETVASVKVLSDPKPKKDRSKPKASSSTPRPPSAFKLVTGSYEKLLYGLEGSITLAEGDGNRISVKLEPIFIFPAHVSCVKAVSGSPMGGKWLATGSVDEIVKVWDLKRRKEVGGLMQHQGQFLKAYALSSPKMSRCCQVPLQSYTSPRDLISSPRPRMARWPFSTHATGSCYGF